MTDWSALLRDDPAAFARELRRGGQQGRALARTRPEFAQVGEEILALHDRFVDALWEPVETQAIERQVLKPQDGAPGRAWDRSTRSVNDENALVLEVADGYVTAVRDHLLGFARLAVAGGPARSMLALARVLLDASVHLSFLLDASVTERARCARALNIRFEALRQELADAQSDVSEAREVTDERDDLMRAAQGDGFTREDVKDRKSGKIKPGWFIKPHDRLDTVMRAAIGDGHMDSWRTLSSVVHAQERPDVRFPLGLGEILPGPHGNQMVMLHAGTPVLLAVEAMRAAETFYGTRGPSIEDDEAAARALRVVMAASGLFDDDIRRSLGFDD